MHQNQTTLVACVGSNLCNMLVACKASVSRSATHMTNVAKCRSHEPALHPQALVNEMRWDLLSELLSNHSRAIWGGSAATLTQDFLVELQCSQKFCRNSVSPCAGKQVRHENLGSFMRSFVPPPCMLLHVWQGNNLSIAASVMAAHIGQSLSLLCDQGGSYRQRWSKSAQKPSICKERRKINKMHNDCSYLALFLFFQLILARQNGGH